MKLRPMPYSMLTALATVALIAACDDSPTTAPDGSFDPGESYALLESSSDVTLEAEGDDFEPGDSVSLTLGNDAGETVGYNLCFHGLERRGADGWTPVDGAGQICTTVLYLLEDGDSVTYIASLPSTLSGGEYRYRTSVHFVERGDSRDQVSNSFQVTG